MTRCCPRHRMPWSGATGAIARGKNRSTGYARRDRSVHAWRWICGAKPKPKAVNKPSPHFIVHGLDKPGDFTTVSIFVGFRPRHSKLRAQDIKGGIRFIISFLRSRCCVMVCHMFPCCLLLITIPTPQRPRVFDDVNDAMCLRTHRYPLSDLRAIPSQPLPCCWSC